MFINESITLLGMLGNAGVIDDRQENEYDLKLNENHRTRQLLKVLAISDIVIYKTRAERLHTDLFYFMGDASKAYNEHFSVELQKVCFMIQPYQCKLKYFGIYDRIPVI